MSSENFTKNSAFNTPSAFNPSTIDNSVTNNIVFNNSNKLYANLYLESPQTIIATFNGDFVGFVNIFNDLLTLNKNYGIILDENNHLIVSETGMYMINFSSTVTCITQDFSSLFAYVLFRNDNSNVDLFNIGGLATDNQSNLSCSIIVYLDKNYSYDFAIAIEPTEITDDISVTIKNVTIDILKISDVYNNQQPLLLQLNKDNKIFSKSFQ
jgi:hypothetical protein